MISNLAFINHPAFEIGYRPVNQRSIDVFRFESPEISKFIGEVLTAYYDDSKNPLVFHGGKFFQLGRQISKS